MEREMLNSAVENILAGQGAQKIPLVPGEEWVVWKAKGQIKLRRIRKLDIIGSEGAQGEGTPLGSPA